MYVSPKYYQTLAVRHATSPFLSPTQNPAYRRELAEFLVADNAQYIAEIGPGYGQLISCLSDLARRDVHVWAIDSCAEFLRQVYEVWRSPGKLRTLCVDINAAVPMPIALLHRRLDRLVAINVLQDVDMDRALRLFRVWLRPGGYLVVTVLAKETMDEVYHDHPMYDPKLGFYYKPSTSGLVLGRRSNGTKLVDYDRIFRCHTHLEIENTFKNTHLQILRERHICYPADTMIARWEATGTLSLIPSSILAKLQASEVYFDAYELLARCTR